MVRRAVLALIAVFCCAVVMAQVENGDTRTGVFDRGMRSLQVQSLGNDQLPPVMTLGGADGLLVKWDELAENRRYMRYELKHCDSQWRVDNLVDSEFVDGFNEGTVDDFAYSYGTKTHYVHYRITLPHGNMRPLVSGNYLLRVYDESDPETTLLQARFYVVEPLTKISADVTSRTDVDYNSRHQQLSVKVDAEKLPMHDYFSNLWLVVSQNSRVDNEHIVAHPLRVVPPSLYFESKPELIFPAGNEYRRFETISTSVPTMGVEDVSYADPYYHFTLYTDFPRYEEMYAYDQTQHGRYRVREYNSDSGDIEAEYAVTHFSLDMPELHNADVFIDGDMMLRRFDEESRMVYNRATRRYEASPLLKQGAYNYQYLVVPRNGSMLGQTASVEGDFYQTVNEYMIRAYYRLPGDRYDRLVGLGMAFSGR
ncbi:MAG: DUF5103 domain-containing protein [Paramuribaculum sp.]|nr:DUF5103 domain-containing protein [Paramuribaculum sp.]